MDTSCPARARGLWGAYRFSEILIDCLSFHANLGEASEEEQSTSFNNNMPKVIPLVRLALGSIALVSNSALAQTYLYTYTGNDFTSVFNAANELSYGIVPYTTSDKITGSISFSSPLGDNYSGNPSANMLSFLFIDGVGPQNIGGQPPFPAYLMNGWTFGTDSSGNIVSWNFEVIAFLAGGTVTKGIQTENEPGNVLDSGNLDQESGIIGQGSVSGSPGVWVETIVPEPSVGLLFVSFAALVLASGRFKPSPPRPHSGK